MSQNQSPLEHMYKIFSEYPLKTQIEGCPHCELNDNESHLHTKKLRELNWKDLGIFSFKAMTTFGDIEDFKHFLPRLLELYIHDFENEPYGLFVLFGKLEYANWQSWKAEEKESLLSAMLYWQDDWKNKFSSEEEVWKLEELQDELEKAKIIT